MSSQNADLTMTSIERVMQGVGDEIERNPKRFFNYEYIHGILMREVEATRVHGKTFASLLFLNTLSLFYVQGIKLNSKIFGIQIQELPASTEILCFFLGLNLFAFAIHTLNVVLYARIKYVVIHKLLITDLTNIGTAHIVGNNLWVDLLTPRFIGSVSGETHKKFSTTVALIFNIFTATLFVASGTSLIALFMFGLKNHPTLFNWPTIVSITGLVMGIVGTLFFFIVQIIPFKFPSFNATGTPDDSRINALFCNEKSN